ncbi:MAG: hypothetical protein ACK4YP_06795 [Myxococcota bacterium]
MIALLVACVSAPGDTASGDTAPVDTDAPAAAADGSVPLGDANNFSYVGTLDAPSFAVAERADVSLSWERLATDLRCNGLDPVADIDNTALLVFPYLTEEEVERGLSEDTMEQADLGVYLSYAPGDATSVSLSQMSFFGTDAEIEAQFEAGSGTWLVLLTTGTSVAVGARMLAFLTPTVDATAVAAEVDDGCAVLDFSADLASLAPVPVLRDGPWRLDWSALTRNGQGGAFVPTRVDGLMVARFDEPVDALEASFLDLELLAEETWSYPVAGGTSADLGALAAGGFPGFHGDGTWALALTCSTCPNPAPLFLTRVQPE